MTKKNKPFCQDCGYEKDGHCYVFFKDNQASPEKNGWEIKNMKDSCPRFIHKDDFMIQ